MKFLFEDDTFSSETLRTTMFANYFGADLGEVLATAARTTDGDEDSWQREWATTAERVAKLGERSLAAGHGVSSRENLLRASNYYRNAAAFLLANPVAALYASEVDTFRRHGTVRSPDRGCVDSISGHHVAGLLVPG
jgi:hypothetical protein